MNTKTQPKDTKTRNKSLRLPYATVSDLPDGAFLRESGFRPHLLPVSRTRFREMVTDGEFPAPVQLTEKIKVWRSGEVKAWFVARGFSAE
jgi:hypothetical protein